MGGETGALDNQNRNAWRSCGVSMLGRMPCCSPAPMK
jgi:hypothetical protein